MTVKRIVANFSTPDPASVHRFYGDLLGLDVIMDHGWIRTYGNDRQARVQVSFATEGGNGTPVPDLSIEVDDLDAVLAKVRAEGVELAYGPAVEPWGVRRFFVRDPLGLLVNILEHVPEVGAL